MIITTATFNFINSAIAARARFGLINHCHQADDLFLFCERHHRFAFGLQLFHLRAELFQINAVAIASMMTSGVKQLVT